VKPPSALAKTPAPSAEPPKMKLGDRASLSSLLMMENTSMPAGKFFTSAGVTE
jgi:hypothetical protein